MNELKNEELYNLAKKRVFAKKVFNMHLYIYILISILLTIISLYNNANWFIFPVLGWGIAIIVHKISLNLFLNSKNQIDNEFNSLKEQNKHNN